MITKKQIDNNTLSDEEIVKRIVNGESYLYEHLMRKFNLRLFRISMSIINDEMEADDVMQTAYINAYMQLSNFQHKSSFSTWLTRILINESLLHKKRKLKQTQLLAAQTDNEYSNDNPLRRLMNKELKVILEKAVSTLPEKYRLVFVMREIEEMSVNETMEILNLGESNVKVRLNRAKEMLRSELSIYYKTNEVFEFNLIRCDRVVNFVMNKINKES
ncbi:RNA polymerase sigma factor [Solitalea canadensis]|uniref:RNA polymerase sigma factor, sigma-70 family n=1 Tax=Solitalea canadensis (strain ATCC 29591 / DSM 3403 / JCM 21819 / LMG 8368 / NBRC 15130 / NCIMB 12057 / USAM 9D) TaxID=929556 RepID=H8KUZ0_SOLCM|nr:RNA polymerase sigma factor [Solitalea canadensis]AFD07690.1 RNA polymerase sigma factor, sigma-70 family [Solitalea canadensis DSM 3403]